MMAQRDYNQPIGQQIGNNTKSTFHNKAYFDYLTILEQADLLPEENETDESMGNERNHNTTSRNSSQCYNETNGILSSSITIPQVLDDSFAATYRSEISGGSDKERAVPFPASSSGGTTEVNSDDGSQSLAPPSWIDSSWFQLHSEDTSVTLDVSKRRPSHETILLPFPVKLQQVLDDAETKGLQHIISWNREGTAFKVHDWKAFERFLMPIYFASQKKYKSFQRQLNLYEFERIGIDKEKGFYRHHYFVQGNRSLCLKMKIRKIKGKSPGISKNAPKDPPPPKVASIGGARDSTSSKAPPFRSNSDGLVVERRKLIARQKKHQEDLEADMFEGRSFYSVAGLDTNLMNF